MKKLISTLLAIIILISSVGASAFAEDEFNIDGLQSSKLEKKGDYWSIGGEYSSDVDGGFYHISVGAYLSSTYVSEGWGPELRITCNKIAGSEFVEVTGFRALVNGITFDFSNLEYNDNQFVHAGYLFGGNVYRQFMENIENVKSASFWFNIIDTDGNPKTVSIGHVSTGQLGELKNIATYFSRANAFSTDTDPEGNDALYGASVL